MVNTGKWLRRNTPFNRALVIAVLYAVLAGLWIAFSDMAVAWMIDDPQLMASVQALKGAFFVVVTSLLLFILVYRAVDGLLRNYQAAVNATRDELTGLAGRASLQHLAPRLFERAQATEGSAAFILVDVNNLNRINDALGVGAGNAVLMEIAKRLKALHRPDITLTRPGSDEFLLMVAPPCTPTMAEETAEKIVVNLEKPLNLTGEWLDIEVSVGIAMYPRDGKNLDQLFHGAERALKDARKNNQKIGFFTGSKKGSLRRLSLERDVKRALDKGEFRVYCQPLVDLLTGRVTGAETLLRWQHPKMGLVSPGAFIPLLEENGGIHEVGAWVLQTGVMAMRQWPAQGDHAPVVSINVSRLQLEAPDFHELAQKALSQCEPECGGVTLELTETLAMQSPEIIMTRLQALKETGASLAMDDFGTGYSSLSYLKNFPFDFIKIDQAFVRGIPNDDDNDLLVQTMQDMTRRLKRKTVAEGVETPSEAARLEALGFRVAQGFLFARPMPLADFNELMEKQPCFTEHKREAADAG